jgi:hypothetical protein
MDLTSITALTYVKNDFKKDNMFIATHASVKKVVTCSR